MKNLIALFCVASAVMAFAEGENVFGVLRVDIGENTKEAIIAVPWLDPGTGNPIKVTDVIKTANLNNGDWLYYYDTATQGYKAWMLESGKWTPATVVKDDKNIADKGSDQTLVRGNAILLKAKDDGTLPSSVYLYGQVATTASGFVEMVRSASANAFTLIAPPRAADTQLSSGSWSGVDAGDTIVIGSLEPFKFDAENNRWGHKKVSLGATGVEITWSETGASIPAGQGAWYISAKGEGPAAKWTWNDLPSTGSAK